MWWFLLVPIVGAGVALALNNRARHRLENLQDHELSQQEATERAVNRATWMRGGN